jgi:hypothetical protein
MQPFFEMTVLPDMKLIIMRYSLLVNGKTSFILPPQLRTNSIYQITL